MMNADNLMCDRVIDRGIVRPSAAASGCNDVNEGIEFRYVFIGFAYSGDVDISRLRWRDWTRVAKRVSRLG